MKVCNYLFLFLFYFNSVMISAQGDKYYHKAVLGKDSFSFLRDTLKYEQTLSLSNDGKYFSTLKNSNITHWLNFELIKGCENFHSDEVPKLDSGFLYIYSLPCLLENTGKFCISFGKYKIKGDTLTLTDEYTQAQWIYKINKPYLFPIQVSPYMKDKVFVDYGETAHPLTIKGEKSSLTSKIKTFVDNNDKNLSLMNCYVNSLEPIVFSLSDNGDYNLFYATQLHTQIDNNEYYNEDVCITPRKNVDILFSSGTWSRDGNILILKDTSLHHEFYGLIKDDETVQLLMFGFDETVFKKR